LSVTAAWVPTHALALLISAMQLTHTHTHTYSHRHTQTLTHTLSHTHTLTHTHTHTHTLSHTHSYTHTLTHTNTYIHTHAHPSVEWQSPGSARATHNRRTGHPDSIISLTPPPTKDVQRWGLASKLVEVRAACCKDFGYCQAVCLGMARIMYIYINGVYSVFWREKHQSVLFYKGWQTML